MNPLFLTLDEVLEIHQQQVGLYGGSHGLRDAAALESAIRHASGDLRRRVSPSVDSLDGRRLLFHVCQGHPFMDGNKRTGANAAITFLLMNDWELTLDEDELVQTVLAVASGVMDKTRLTALFENRCQPAASPLLDR